MNTVDSEANAVQARVLQSKFQVLQAILYERKTSDLRTRISRVLAMQTGVPQQDMRADQFTATASGYVQNVPDMLFSILQTARQMRPAADALKLIQLVNSAIECFTNTPEIPDALGIGGMLDNAYLAYTLFPQAGWSGAPHQLVRQLLGPNLIADLERKAANIYGAATREQPTPVGDEQETARAVDGEPQSDRDLEHPTDPAPPDGDQHLPDLPADLQPGALDPTFGSGGQVTTANMGQARAAVMQSDGKIVVVGKATPGGFSVARYNADGSLDDRFGNAGSVYVPLGAATDEANAVALQGDHIIVAGTAWSVGFAVARLDRQGALDPTFGQQGRVTTKPANRDNGRANAIAVQADGKIVVVGAVGLMDQDLAVVRYESDGELDRGFGGDGTGAVITDFTGGFDEANAVCVQADGSIVIAGRTAGKNAKLGDFCVARYTERGMLDETFGKGGKVATDFSRDRRYTDDSARALALLPDGRILLAGTSGDDFSRDAAIACYRADGSLDTSFGADGSGCVTVDFGRGYEQTGLGASQFDLVEAIALQENGQFLLGGSTHAVAGDVSADFLVARFNADGTKDLGFGTEGFVTTDFGGSNDYVAALAFQGADRIVAAGYTGSVGAEAFAVACYANSAVMPRSESEQEIAADGTEPTASDEKDLGRGADSAPPSERARVDTKEAPPASAGGLLDYEFNQGGIVITSFGHSLADARAVAVQGDGRIIVAGALADRDSGQPRDVAIAQYMPDGGLDESFADGGRTVVSVGGGDVGAHALALQADGKIVVAGESLDVESNSLDAIVMRLDRQGTLDKTFNGNGIVITEFLPGSDDKAYAVVVRDDGGIVIGGYTTETTEPQPETTAGDNRLRSEAFALTSYTRDGVPDTAFGEAGVVITSFPGDLARVLALCVDPSGRILAAGLVRSNRPDAVGATDFIVVRYGRNGKVDPTFGTDGHTIVDVEGTDDIPEAIAIQADGGIVVAGSAVRPDTEEAHFLIVRLDQGGALDATFNGSGTVMTEAFKGVARAIAVQEDGGILVTGYGRSADQAGDAATDKDRLVVVRYLQDGKLDPGFGDAGVVWLDLAGQSDRAYAAALQDDGKLLVAGTSRSGDVSDFVLVRLLARGGGGAA